MIDYNHLRASDGNGSAVLARVVSPRTVGSTVLEVDNLSNWDDNFILTTGELGPNGLIAEDTITEMRAHLDGGQIIIDGFEPGHTDKGNAIDDVAVIKPTTGWANGVVDLALVSHNQDGTLSPTALAQVYPVGSIYINAADSTNPATLFGFGTWVAFGAGRVPVGFNSGETEFNAAEKTGGAKTVSLTTAQMPSHTHNAPSNRTIFSGVSSGTLGRYAYQPWSSGTQRVTFAGDSTGDLAYLDGVVTASTGSGNAHNNIQPYITVYMWKRTA